MKRKWPLPISDEEAEQFVETADLSEFDFSERLPVGYEFEKKTTALNMRI